MSQEDLADRSNLSLRTIQRIESGATMPRGDTLQRLAGALQVSPDELIDWQIEEDTNVLTVLNLSQLGYIAFPLLGLVIPLAIWILKKNSIRDVDRVGQAILNFQATWNLVLFAFYGVAFLNIFVSGSTTTSLFRTWLIGTGGLYVYNFVLVVFNTVRYRRRQEVWYGPAFAFLK